MSLLTIPFYAIIALDIVSNIMMLLFMVEDNGWDLLPELFNPIIIYKEHKVNYFGCFMVMIFYHAIFSPFAIGYWMYMLSKLFVWLCTVGRR